MSEDNKNQKNATWFFTYLLSFVVFFLYVDVFVSLCRSAAAQRLSRIIQSRSRRAASCGPPSLVAVDVVAVVVAVAVEVAVAVAAVFGSTSCGRRSSSSGQL